MTFGFSVAVLYAVLPDLDVLLTELFRLDDENAYSRFSIWKDMLNIASDLNAYEILLGGGYLFIQDVYGSPYNAFIRIFFNQGLLYLIGLVVVIIQIFIYAAKDGDRLRKSLTVSLLGYWLSFSMFLDTLFAEFFHASEFVFWLAAALVVTSNLTSRNVKLSKGSIYK